VPQCWAIVDEDPHGFVSVSVSGTGSTLEGLVGLRTSRDTIASIRVPRFFWIDETVQLLMRQHLDSIVGRC